MNRRLSLSAVLLLVLFALSSNAQNTFPSTGSAGIGTTAPAVSSLLDMESASKGLLIPRLSIAQRNAIAAPATGLLIYQTDGTAGFYYYNGSIWLAVTQWTLSGNNVTYSAGDAVIHGITFGTGKGGNSTNTVSGYNALASNTTGNWNTANGVQSLTINSNGYNNTGIGANALEYNASGSNNTAIGYSSLISNQNGYSNVAVGIDALLKNTFGSNQIAVGDSALYSNKGSFNTAIGSKVLFSNTTGHSNVAMGIGSLFKNQTGSNQVAIGDSALFNNIVNGTNFDQNTAIGSKALYANTIGFCNSAIGFQALFSNTTGYYNTATGYTGLYLNTSGYCNTANGYGPLSFNTRGSSNTANGFLSLYYNTTGSFNTANGGDALYANRSGSFNTADGSEADVNDTAYSNSSAFGYAAIISASNQVRIGNNSSASIGGYTGWSNVSDGRVKTNIKQNVPGLAFINKLQPITYNLNLDAADKIIQAPLHKDKDGKTRQPSEFEVSARKAKEQIVYSGFIAQDVEKAAKSLHYDFSGVDAAKNEKDLYGLRYAEFVVPLVKAVQELNDSLEKTNASLQSQIDELKTMVSALANKESVAVPSVSATLSPASLQQNVPNPYSNTTSIAYTLPDQFSSAQIIITDNSGKTLKQITVSGAGKGMLTVDASTLSAGAYHYSLVVDGRMIGTKTMLLEK